MKKLGKYLVILLILVGVVAAAYRPMAGYWKDRNRTKYRFSEVSRGPIVFVVNSTGTIKPVLSVAIGSFVSGPIEELFVDFNDEVNEGDLLAKIDPRIYQANVARDEAVLAIQRADKQRVEAVLQQSRNDEQRAMALHAVNEDFISEAELDQLKYNRMSLEAQLTVAEAAVKQAQASLENSSANLGYTDIRSPVDGIVTERKIDPGQTLAAQFQTPELFTVAPDMEKTMHVFASVDEADIGLIREAQERDQPVHFTVDAYPDDLFEGKIFQVRKSPATTQNVVTYPVLVAAPNPELKLLPGMTANLSFQVDKRDEVVRIPNDAIRYYPLEREKVRPEDRKLLDGAREEETENEGTQSALEKAKARQKRNRRHVWIVEGEFLRAVEVVIGLNDYRYSELVSGDLKVDQKLVTGVDTGSN